MAVQFAVGLEPYGASLYTGKLVSLGIVRELGPTLTAVLVGGRVGSGFAAEIGSMTVTEQVDAIRALGANPIKKLVAPRVLACIIMLPLLTILADFVGCFGGMLVVMKEVGITWRFFVDQILETLWIEDLVHGLKVRLLPGTSSPSSAATRGSTSGHRGVDRAIPQVVAISITIWSLIHPHHLLADLRLMTHPIIWRG